MVKIIKYNNKSGFFKLVNFLEHRRNFNIEEVDLVKKIIEDVKKNKLKALIKYEKRYSKNNQIKVSKKKNR